MHDAFRVQARERGQDLQEVADDLAGRARVVARAALARVLEPVGLDLRERPALDEVHGVEAAAGGRVLAELVDVDQVRVLHAREQLRFAAEAAQRLAIGLAGLEQLQRAARVEEVRVDDLEDPRHPAARDVAPHRVAADALEREGIDFYGHDARHYTGAGAQIRDDARPMALRCGIVGLPNIGKSTLFNALTDSRIAAENYPFCTIEPNSGVVPVPDGRLAALDAIVHSARVVPATVEFVDIAGLVRGASQGEGLGNKFLAHIRETAAIIHVVRCFEDPDVVHVDGRPDPLRDVETIETELALADLDTAEKRAERARKVGKSGDKEAQAECAFFEKLVAHLSAGQGRAHDRGARRAGARLPRVVAAHREARALRRERGRGGARRPGNAFSNALEAHARATGAGCVRICAKVEAELVELESAEREAFLAELGADASGLARLIGEAYRLLELISYFTAGPKEVRAWTIRRGTKAPQAAAEIHTDFERGFIRAEVIPFDDYIACDGEVGAKERGKMRVEGKDYVVADGDVMHFRIAT